MFGRRNFLYGAGVVASALATGALLPLTALASPSPVSGKRISGSNRYSTAVEVSKVAFPNGSDVVYLATGENFPDAVAAGPLAALTGGPILLTAYGSLPTSTYDEIERLAPSRVVVIGGSGTISDAVMDKATQAATSGK